MAAFDLPSNSAIAAAFAEVAALIKTELDALIARSPAGVQPTEQQVEAIITAAFAQVAVTSGIVQGAITDLKALFLTGRSAIDGAPGADLV